MIVLAALVGAVVALALHEWVEWLLRLQQKRADCPHNAFKVTTYMGYKTRHCKDCGWQEAIREDLH